MRRWFHEHSSRGWATCPLTESGFVRVSSNRKALPSAIGVEAARKVLAALRAAGEHSFLPDDVSPTDRDFPAIAGHRQVTDAHLLTLARRRGARLVTFDAGIASLAEEREVELLSPLQ
jgi:toxin-antitoxin system PIN domain toxin